MRDILIATCGTSIIGNARDIKTEVLGNRNYNQMTKEEGLIIKDKIKNKLKNKNMTDKDFGAELNSTFYLIEKGEFSKKIVYLIVSDTIEGELAGELIKELLIENLKIEKVEIRKIEKLNIAKEYEFSIKGLRNLVGEVTKIIKNNNTSNIMISPIGGLKAQIFVVGLIAQLFKIPAYYLYENSTEIITLLPLPISLDMEFFKENIEIISKIAKEEIVSKNDIESYLKTIPNLRNILEEVKIGKETYFSLSPLGEIAYEKLNFDCISKLPRDAKKEEKLKEVQFKGNEAHADQIRTNSKFQNFTKNILEAPYVIKMIINYYNPKNKGDIIRLTKSSNEKEGRVIRFEYNNKQGILGGSIFITEQDEEKIEAGIIDLYSRI